MWIKRVIESELLELALQYPVVMITGPRHAGKTSLAQRCFPDKPYFSLENPDLREQITADPRGFFRLMLMEQLSMNFSVIPIFSHTFRGL